MIDTHAHLEDSRFDGDRDACLHRAYENSVVAVVNAGVSRERSEAAARLARDHPRVWATVGVHPHGASDAADDDLAWIVDLLHHEGVLGIGETGLDYHYDHSPRDVQRRVFRRQLELAKRLEVPVVIHDREAHDDCFAILEEELPPQHPVLLHCFSGDAALMERALGRGYYLGLGGVVTFKNARDTREVAARVPLDRLCLETDAPYLAPHPRRGRRNEPALIPHIARKIARLRGIPMSEVADSTTCTARAFFGHPLVEEAGPCSS